MRVDRNRCEDGTVCASHQQTELIKGTVLIPQYKQRIRLSVLVKVHGADGGHGTVQGSKDILQNILHRIVTIRAILIHPTQGRIPRCIPQFVAIIQATVFTFIQKRCLV